MTVYRKQESMNERSIGIKSHYANFRNIDNTARPHCADLASSKCFEFLGKNFDVV